VAILADQDDHRIPTPLRDELLEMADLLSCTEKKLKALDARLVTCGRDNATVRHLITVPGYGPILSTAMAAFVVNPAVFRSGGDFVASIGLVPRQDGTGGKMKLGPISKRGNTYLRRLLVNGAMSVLSSKRGRQDPWLLKLLASKPRKLVAVALANKMARIGWALMMRQEDFRAMPTAA
jgi:transposase